MEENIYDNQKARELLEALGIPPYLRGYQMTLLALEYIADDPRRIQGIRKQVYPPMGERLQCDAAAVEGAIRRTTERGSAGNALRRSAGAQAPAKGFSLGTVQCLL